MPIIKEGERRIFRYVAYAVNKKTKQTIQLDKDGAAANVENPSTALELTIGEVKRAFELFEKTVDNPNDWELNYFECEEIF